MVGVPGKFVGCETCRLKRINCDNTKPYCNRCKKSSRKCQGYERPTTFVLSGPSDGGRCSLQPRRQVGRKQAQKQKQKQKQQQRSRSATGDRSESSEMSTKTTASSTYSSSSKGKEVEGVEQTPRAPDGIVADPQTSAWDDFANISKNGFTYFPRVVALHAQLGQIQRSSSSQQGAADKAGKIRVCGLKPLEIRPSPGDEEFEVKAQCLFHLSPNDVFDKFLSGEPDSFCLFVYEQNSSLAADRYGHPWKFGANDPSSIRIQGPDQFRHFPAHQFFARVYRPNTIYTALLNRKPLYLSTNDWMTVPWEIHRKTHLDTLFDIIIHLPELFFRADKTTSTPPTYDRRLKAQDLLSTCQRIERMFRDWHEMVVLTISQYSSTPSSAHSSPRPQPSRSSTPGGATSSSSVGSPSASLEDLETLPALEEPSNKLLLGPKTPYWLESPDFGDDAHLPFLDQHAFSDGHTALAFIHYWTAQILLFRCIHQIHTIIIEPVASPQQQQSPPQQQHGQFQTATFAAQMGMHTQQNFMAGYGIPVTTSGRGGGYGSPMAMAGSAVNVGGMMQISDMQPQMMTLGQYPHPHQHHGHVSGMPQSPPIPQIPQVHPPMYPSFGDGSMGGMAGMTGLGVSGYTPTTSAGTDATATAGLHHHLGHPKQQQQHQFPPAPPHSIPPSSSGPTAIPHISSLALSSSSPTPNTHFLGTHPGLPDPTPYTDASVRELAEKVCRSLVFALARSTARWQPDSLSGAVMVVGGFYRHIGGVGRIGGMGNREGGDFRAELEWCEWFRGRVESRKEEVEGVIGGREWVEGGW